MNDATRRAFERAEDDLAEQYNNGVLDNHEFNVEMRELGREYREEAEAAGGDMSTARCKRCGGTPVVAEVEGRTLVCATCRDDREFRDHARRDYR